MMTLLSKSILVVIIAFCAFGNSYAQQPDVKQLPEYVIITTENTKLLGGIGLTIDYKKSPYRDQLIKLEDYLTLAKQNRVRTQTDLLNAMYTLGFEYVDAFNSNADTFGGNTDVGDRSELSGSNSKFRINIVFKKKP